MIKRIRFAVGQAGTDAGDGSVERLRRRLATGVEAPNGPRPVRVTIGTTLVDARCDHGYAGVGLEWFADLDHLARFEAWSARATGSAAAVPPGDSGDRGPEPVIVAEEHVVRGADWLEDRWRDRTVVFKHLAIARRAAGLTPAQFAETWRTGAGRVQRSGRRDPLVIPDDVRGRAYVQNHPVPRDEGEWAYDAVNEVSFDDLDGLRTRVAWFREHVGDDADRDLISANWFIEARDEVLHAAT